MNNSEEILNELKGISPLLAGLEKINVFQVPDGYFNNLSEHLFDFALLNTKGELDLNRTNVQQVPDGYFDTLSTNILAKIKTLYSETTNEEPGNLSPMLDSLKDKNVFTIPEGYFGTLSTEIFAKIEKLNLEKENAEPDNLSEIFYSLRNANVFSVPAGYFDTLSTKISAKIEDLEFETVSEELQNLSPVLSSLKNENVFTVPEGYFDSFANIVIKKAKPTSAKILTMTPRTTWLRIAAAAVVTGVIAIASLQIFNSSSNDGNSKPPTIASIEIPGYIKESLQFKTEKQLDAGIAKLSDDDIIKYLEKNGNVLDNDVLLKNTDVSELPSQEDYLDNENTLNSYLDKIDRAGNSN